MCRAEYNSEQKLDNMLPEYQLTTRRQDFQIHFGELTHLLVTYEGVINRENRDPHD